MNDEDAGPVISIVCVPDINIGDAVPFEQPLRLEFEPFPPGHAWNLSETV